MKYIKKFSDEVTGAIKEASLKDTIMSFLPASFRNEVPFSQGIQALYGLTMDHSFIAMAMRKRLKKLEASGSLSISKAEHKELRADMDDIDFITADLHKAYEALDRKWSKLLSEESE